MARELTNTEMKAVIEAAINALPTEAKDNSVIILISAQTPKGNWVNRVSNLGREFTNEILLKWTQAILRKDTFGEDNNN